MLKRRSSRVRLYCTGVFLAIFLGVSSSSFYAHASHDDAGLLTPALSVIAEESGMAKAGIVGEGISFEKDDFLRALNLSDVDAIVITEAPPTSEGELRVGNTVITGGQTLGALALSELSFTPSSDLCTRSSFRFRAEGSGYDLACELYMLTEGNSSPTLSVASAVSLNVSTHRNVSFFGTLPWYDPDGDEAHVEIVRYPKAGSIRLTDKSTGEYVYTPSKNFSGKDSFCYVARDKYGNYSASREVNLEITRPTTTVSFDDMESSPYYNAALTMVEEGIMSGTQVGADTYFYPERTVTRGEFVVMMMHALGIDDVCDTATTPFADDGDIPEQMKGYVSAAYSLGYVSGSVTEQGLCFEANRSITRAEAAVMLGNALDVATPTILPTFSDSADVPAWAAPSLYSLCSVGVIDLKDGEIAAKSALSRADAAQILTNLISFVK